MGKVKHYSKHKPIDNPNLIGLVLCGGESKRMGRDKGLLLIKGRDTTWAENAFTTIQPYCSDVLISINIMQFHEYSRIFQPKYLLIDSTETKGPITGILSAHKAFSQKDLLIVATDMIHVDKEILDFLIMNYIKERNEYRIFCFINNNQIEPLCSIYTSESLKKINEENYFDKLKNFRLVDLIRNERVKYINVSSKQRKKFLNYNTLLSRDT